MPSPKYYWVKFFLAVRDVELVVQAGPDLDEYKELGEIYKGAVGHDILVRLHLGRGQLGGGVGHKLQFELLAVVHGVMLHDKGSDADVGSSTEGDIGEETVHPGGLVDELPNAD